MCAILSNSYCVGRGVHNETIAVYVFVFKCLCLSMTLLSNGVHECTTKNGYFYNVMRWVEHNAAVQWQPTMHKDRFNASHGMWIITPTVDGV